MDLFNLHSDQPLPDDDEYEACQHCGNSLTSIVDNWRRRDGAPVDDVRFDLCFICADYLEIKGELPPDGYKDSLTYVE